MITSRRDFLQLFTTEGNQNFCPYKICLRLFYSCSRRKVIKTFVPIRFAYDLSTAVKESYLGDKFPSEPVEVPEEYSVLSLIAGRFMEQLGANFPEFRPDDLQDASWLGYRLTELLPLQSQEKQTLLQITDPLDRLQVLLEVLPRFQEPRSEC